MHPPILSPLANEAMVGDVRAPLTPLTLCAASTVCPVQLCTLLTDSFRHYLGGPVPFTHTRLLHHVRREGVDLTRSLVGLCADVPVGVALVARRGSQARLSLLAIANEHKGMYVVHVVMRYCRIERDTDCCMCAQDVQWMCTCSRPCCCRPRSVETVCSMPSASCRTCLPAVSF